MPNLIPCFVINLEKDTQRRSAMQTRLAKLGITPTFFKAVDGRLMSPEALEGHVNRIRAQQEYGSLSAAEIGTSLSHIGIYQEMVEKNIPHAVILEDDVCLDANFATYLNTHGPDSLAAHFAPTQAAMVQLTHIARGKRFGARPLGQTKNKAVQASGGVWLASGYFITLAAAEKLAQHLYPVWTVADHWNRFEEKGLVSLWALQRNIVWEAQEAQESNLSPTRKPRVKPQKTLKTRLHRVFYELLTKPFFTQKLKRHT
jgi:glycosyl transferase family 25